MCSQVRSIQTKTSSKSGFMNRWKLKASILSNRSCNWQKIRTELMNQGRLKILESSQGPSQELSLRVFMNKACLIQMSSRPWLISWIETVESKSRTFQGETNWLLSKAKTNQVRKSYLIPRMFVGLKLMIWPATNINAKGRMMTIK